MKRLPVVIAVALAAVAAYAVSAPAGQEAVSPKRVAALEKRMATAEKGIKDLKTVANALAGCLFINAGAVPVSQFGGANNEGYLYRLANGTTVVAPALDVVPQAQQAQARAFMIVTNAECAAVINQQLRVVPKLSLKGGKAQLDRLAKP